MLPKMIRREEKPDKVREKRVGLMVKLVIHCECSGGWDPGSCGRLVLDQNMDTGNSW